MPAPLRVAVVGSGPSGAFCAQLLTEDAPFEVQVDVFERLPTPFGLVRYGVAPDHQKIKSIVGQFTEIFERPGVRFLGNVQVGADITIAELRRHYDAIVLACGAPLDRQLGIPGEHLQGVVSARDFVAWYSGHPESSLEHFSLAGHERAVVVGVGNVALDVARMLVRTPEELRRTDVPEHVVEVLAASTISEICVVGRRGPAHARFTNKELLELAAVEGADVVVDPAELELDAAAQAYVDANPAASRLLGTLRRIAERPPAGRTRSIRFCFDRTPVQLVGDAAVAKVRLARSSDPAALEDMATDLVLRSVGFRGAAVPDLPFDEASATIPHQDSRVMNADEPVPGLYVAGWIKRGPSGVIGTNRRCAAETVEAVLADAGCRPRAATAPQEVDQLLSLRGVCVVDWPAWRLIEQAEAALGRATGRDRVKLHQHEEMLRIAGGA